MTRLPGTQFNSIIRRSLSHEDLWSPSTERKAFFGFFLAGVIAIVILKSRTDSQVIVTAAPCALMLAYAALLWDFDERLPRSSTAGDNLYYLGFLYTLTSLGHSLYRFSAASAKDTEAIISNFGIAISTTILGMALRILVGRPPVDEVSALDEAVRQDLAAAARELRAELRYTVNLFHEQLEEDQQLFLKHMQSSRRKIAKVEEGVDKAAAGLIARAQDLEDCAVGFAAFRESVHRLDARVKDAEKAIEEHATALAEGSGEVSEALQAQARKVRAVDLCQALQEIFKLGSASLQGVVDQTGEQVDARVKSLLQACDEYSAMLAANSDAVRKSLQEQAERIGEIDFRQAFIDHGIKPASTELQAAAAEFSTLLGELRRADDAREQALVNCEKATTSLRDALNRQHDVATAVLGTASKLQEALDTLNSVSGRLARSSEGVEEAARQISQVSEEISESAERTRIVNEGLTRARLHRTRRWYFPWRR